METNKIYNEDCLTGVKKIPDNSVDLVIIDPPYDLGEKTSTGKSNVSRTICSIYKELSESNLTNGYDMKILDDLVRIMKNINIYIFCNGKQIPFYIDYFVNKLNCKMEILIWNKTNVLPLYSNRYMSDKEYCLYFRKRGYCQPQNYEDAKTVFTSTTNIKDKKKYGHPTIKPMDLIRKLIRNSSKENEIIFDCFLGSGTTACASILENRKYIGFEKNKEFFDIANTRIKETEDLMRGEK